nr:cyclic lactone autoinducer peptide [Cohnella sp. WQ 127256]
MDEFDPLDGFIVLFYIFNTKPKRRRKQVKKKILISFSKGLALFAVVFVSTACVWLFHRPEVPEELRS